MAHTEAQFAKREEQLPIAFTGVMIADDCLTSAVRTSVAPPNTMLEGLVGLLSLVEWEIELFVRSDRILS